MKKLITATLTLLLATAFLPLSAQQNRCKVTGIVSAANEHTLQYASVYISKHDSVIAGTLTNPKGHFEMEIAQTKDSCLLTVVFMGYKTKQMPFLANTPQVSLGTILMEATSQQLDEVYVTAKQGCNGSTYVDVTTTRLQPTDATSWMGGSIGDVLRTEPSVTIDPNGNVSLRGNGNVLLLLDGVPTNLGSIDAIPSSNVASIDIIKNPNATYDAEGTGGIINIVTKKGALTVSAQLTDVFNTRKWEVFSDNQYYRLENMLQNKSRMFWLGVSYNFNAYKKSGAPKPASDDRSIIRTGV